MKQLKQLHSRFQHTFRSAFRNEWKAIIQDRGVVSTFISMGLLIVVVYSFIYGEEVVYDVPIAVIDQDFSKSSRDFTNMVDANPSARSITAYVDLEAAKTDFYKGKVHGIVLLPKDFERDIRTDRQPTISLYSDASNLVLHRAVLGSVLKAQGYYNGGIRIKRAIAAGESPGSLAPIGMISTALFNPGAGYGLFIVPTITALVLQLLILLAIGILGGRSNVKWLNVIEHKVLRPGGTIPVLLGRASLYVVIFLVVLPIQYGVIFSLFSFPSKASLPLVYVFNFPYITSLVFLGIFLSTFFKRSEDAILFFSILVIPSMVLSGITFPYEGFRPFFRFLAQFLPSTPGSRGMVKLTQFGATFNEVQLEWLKLWGLSLFYFVLTAINIKIRATKARVRRIKKATC